MKVRLNPEIFPEDKRNIPTFQSGKLNYLAKFLDWEYQVINEFKDDFRGDMLTLKVLNYKLNNEKNELVFIKDDCLVIEE